MQWLDLVLGVASGGATGLLGTALSGVLGHFKQKQAHKQSLELRSLDLQFMDKEQSFALDRAEVAAEAAETKAEYEGLKASYAEASVRYSQGMPLTPAQSGWLVLVDVVRGLMRPTLTTFLLGLTAVVYFTVSEGDDLRSKIIATILYLTTTAVTWWLGSRQLEKAGNK